MDCVDAFFGIKHEHTDKTRADKSNKYNFFKKIFIIFKYQETPRSTKRKTDVYVQGVNSTCNERMLTYMFV